MYEKDKLSKSRYQPLVKYLLTEDFSFQVLASEDFEHLWIKRKGVHGVKALRCKCQLSDRRNCGLDHYLISTWAYLADKIESVVDFKLEQFDFSLLTFIARYQILASPSSIIMPYSRTTN